MRAAYLLAGVCLGAVLPNAAQAGTEPLIAPPPSWVKPLTLKPLAAAAETTGGQAFLLFDRQVHLGADGVVSYAEIASRINSAETLAQAVNLVLPWHPDKGNLTIHRLELVRPTGTVDVLKSGQKFTVLRREAQLEQLQVSGMLTATMQIEGAQVGDTLRLAFSVGYKDPAMDGNVNTLMPLALNGANPLQTQVRVLWPTSLPVKWKVSDDSIKPELSKSGDVSELVFAGPVPKKVAAPDDAPLRYRQPVTIEATTFTDWKAVSATNAKLYATGDAIKDNAELSAEVKRIADASTDQRVRAAMALQLVQDKVRYLFNGLALGAYVPATPAETWSRKFGDCKAKTFLLLSLLRELGVEAEPILVSAGTGGAVRNRLPAFQAFDHIVVRAKVDGKWLWLDGTSLGDRIEDLEDVPNYEFGLPVRIGGADLERLDARPSARPQSVLAIEYDQSAGLAFPTPFTFRNTLRGSSMMALRMAKDAFAPDKFAGVLDQVVKSAISEASIIEKSVTFDDKSGEATVTATGIVTPSWSIEEERESFWPSTSLRTFDVSASRTNPAHTDIPVNTDFPSYSRTSVKIKLPNKGEGFDLVGTANYAGTIGGVELKHEASIKDGVMSLTNSSRTLVTEISASALPEARAALAKAQATPLKLAAPKTYPSEKDEVAAAKKDGRLAALKAAFAKLKPANAEDVDPYLYRGRFYDILGDKKATLADVDKLVAQVPIVENYLWRARLRMDTNVDGALSDIAAARALEPASNEVINQLVAVRLAKKDMKTALADIEAAMDTGPDKASLLQLKAQVLEEDKQLDKAMAALDSAVALSPGKPDILNARCWMKATNNVQLDTALKDCTKAIDLMEEPAPALDSRGLVYLQMKRYDDAIADFDAALKRLPNLSASLYARGVARLRKGDKVGGDADLARARAISSDVDKDYAKYGVVP